jgi:hypothetical protein
MSSTMTASDAVRARRLRTDLALIVLFVVAMTAPLVDMAIRRDAARSPEKAEQRTPAPFPPLTYRSLVSRTWPDRFTKYFDDAFGLRDVLLRWHSLEKLFVFGVSSTRSVVIGRDDWMFYTKEHSLEIFRGVRPFREDELEQWRRMLESQRDFLRTRGIELLLVVGPNKETIYPDYVPAKYNRVGPTRFDQMTEYLEKHSDMRFVDLRPVLAAARADDRPFDHLYYELGTHWNGRGGLVAAREIQRHLAQLFPSIPVTDPSAVMFGTVADDPGDSEAGWMYVSDLFPQHWNWFQLRARRAQVVADGWTETLLRRTKIDDPRLPRALIFHDSFGPGVEPLLSECFSRSTWVHSAFFDTRLIEAEAPDVVIEIYVERLFDTHSIVIIPDNLSSGPTRAADARRTHYRLDVAHARDELELEGQLEIALDRDAEGPFVSLVMHDGADMFLLPEFEWPTARGVLVDLDITAPVASSATVFYLVDEHAQYDRRWAASADLVPGENRVTIKIPSLGSHGRLKIRPGADRGRYVVRNIEVRSPDPR